MAEMSLRMCRNSRNNFCCSDYGVMVKISAAPGATEVLKKLSVFNYEAHWMTLSHHIHLGNLSNRTIVRINMVGRKLCLLPSSPWKKGRMEMWLIRFKNISVQLLFYLFLFYYLHFYPTHPTSRLRADYNIIIQRYNNNKINMREGLSGIKTVKGDCHELGKRFQRLGKSEASRTAIRHCHCHHIVGVPLCSSGFLCSMAVWSYILPCVHLAAHVTVKTTAAH